MRGKPPFGHYDADYSEGTGEPCPGHSQNIVFDTRKEVDFVIIGSGAAGGVMAKELSMAGFDVVVLEQGALPQSRGFCET